MNKNTFPMVRNLPDTDTHRARAVVLDKGQHSPACGVWLDGYTIVMAQRCWTGGEWLSIVHRDSCETFERAVEIAREMVEELHKSDAEPLALAS